METKTALEWFLKEFNNLIKEDELTEMNYGEFDNKESQIVEQAKEMEKQLIIDSYNEASKQVHEYYDFIRDESLTYTKEPLTAEQYYNLKFNTK